MDELKKMEEGLSVLSDFTSKLKEAGFDKIDLSMEGEKLVIKISLKK